MEAGGETAEERGTDVGWRSSAAVLWIVGAFAAVFLYFATAGFTCGVIVGLSGGSLPQAMEPAIRAFYGPCIWLSEKFPPYQMAMQWEATVTKKLFESLKSLMRP